MANAYEEIVRQAVSAAAGTGRSATSLDGALAAFDARAAAAGDALAQKERKAARDVAAAVSAAYDAQVQNAAEQARAAKGQLVARYMGDLDVSAVEELVERRQLEERLAQMGLVRSGVGVTGEVAIGLQKANADASARAARAAGEAQLESEVRQVARSAEAAKLKNEQEVLYEAEKRVGDAVAALGRQAGDAALSAYKAQLDAAGADAAAADKRQQYLSDLAMEAAKAAQSDAQAEAKTAAQSAQTDAKATLDVAAHNASVIKLAAGIEDAALRARVLRQLL